MIRTLHVIHHSHTDIGYTHGQARIIRWHGQFIRQAMQLARRHEDFRWQCETFFPVESFWRDATEAERREFADLVRIGRIGLSGSYFNYTELPDRPLLSAMAARSRAFADEHKLPLRGAMTADINGTSITHARALADAGIELLVTFMHPHHGYLPFGRRFGQYDWDLGDGRSIAVVHSDHYHVGNELGLAPFAATNYLWGWDGVAAHPYREELLDERLPAYLQCVEADGWSADWFVVAKG